MPRPRRAVRRRLLAVPAAAVLVLFALAAAGCSGGGSKEPSSAPTSPSTPAPTPLAQVPTTELTVARASFCAQVAPDAVSAALGSAPARSERWRNGQRVALAPGLTDVAHEYGCRWLTRGGASAAAWVFAPPVTRAGAARLRRDAAGADGCHVAPGIPRFGRPTVAVRCADRRATTLTLHGLFGDAWLSCSLTQPSRGPGGPARAGGSLVHRAEQWCVNVALAASA